MNSLFGHGIKQIQSIRKDLTQLESSSDAPLSAQGQVSVSLNGLQRTIDELADLILKETNDDSQAKYKKRLEKFRSEHLELKTRFESIKRRKEEVQYENSRSELLNRGRHNNTHGLGGTTTSTDNPYSSALGQQQQQQQQQPRMNYQDGLYKERESLGRSSAQLDEILEMGQRSFDDIVIQNQYLMKFEKKLTSSLTTLGVSQETIHKVERRVYQDRFLFAGGAFILFFCYFFIYKYLK
ncbi:Bos1 protein [Saccharomycopsis crataegensis]|uniref:Protein transport protein BOS1 n=1 Tax=Saccharomycopsis crataegensis TaxID=43959 RepID=A0AAV5QK10_9ASCO|nr:Bos1 protein [Saccharomycopsis crataegensis]